MWEIEEGLKMKKRLICLLLVAVLTWGLAACSAPSDQSTGNTQAETTVNLFTWVKYVPDEMIKKFTDETGIKVNYTNFSTNEEMLTKLQSGAGNQYDVIICSDYMIETMRQAGGLMTEIDTSKIENYKNVNPDFQSKSYDPENKYSIPYSAGSPMIVYDPAKVGFEITGYADLWDERLADSVVLLNDARNIIGITLKKMGYSMNETNPDILEQAKKELFKIKPNVKLLDADTPHMAILGGEASAGYMFASQAAAAIADNPELKIVYPKEGMGIGIDSLMIPTSAPHKNAAYQFINFLLDAQNSAKISEEIDYQNTNTAATQYLSQEYFNNGAVNVPSEYLKDAESIMEVGEAATVYDRIWTEFVQQ